MRRIFLIINSILNVKSLCLAIWLSDGSEGKESACNTGDQEILVQFLYQEDLQVRKIPWRRKQQPTPVFLPDKSHWKRSLVGYSPESRKESDTTKQLSTHSQEKKNEEELAAYTRGFTTGTPLVVELELNTQIQSLD